MWIVIGADDDDRDAAQVGRRRRQAVRARSNDRRSRPSQLRSAARRDHLDVDAEALREAFLSA